MFKRRPGSLPQHFRLRATSGTDSPKARSGTTDTSGTYELISECFLNAPYILRHHLYRQKDEENQNCQLKNMDQEEDQTLLGKSRELLYMNFPFLLTILSNCKAFHFPWFLCVCVCVCERERERERERSYVCVHSGLRISASLWKALCHSLGTSLLKNPSSWFVAVSALSLFLTANHTLGEPHE